MCSFCPNLNQTCKYGGKCRDIFLREGMCWRSSTAIGFCNGIEHVGPCWNYGCKGWHGIHSSPFFVVFLTCLVSGVQYANLVLIALLLEQSFLDDRRCATTFDNPTVVELEDCTLP